MRPSVAGAGFEPHMHADGDRAVHEGLDGIEALRAHFPGRDIRAAIAHDEIVDPKDFVRYRALDVLPVLSFQWEKPAPDTIEGARDYLGPARFKYLEPAAYLAGAGGNLAGDLATVNDPGEAKAEDPIERVSDRPDFAIVSYGRFTMDDSIPRKTNMEGLLGAHPTQAMMDQVSVVKKVTKATPPCFIFATTADQTVNSLNATAFYDALKRVGVPVELHIFERGTHGLGMGQGMKRFPEVAIYPTLVANWMAVHGWMTQEESDGSEARTITR